MLVDVQNGFVAKGGSYDKIGMNTALYREIIPKLKDLIEFCRTMGIPVFYTEAVKESSGIDILTNIHNILPKSRQERLKVPICIRGTWDGVTIDELKPKEKDPVGYDVMIISDATASGDKRHYETTLERVRDYYGLVMDTERFKRAIGKLDMVRKGQIDVRTMPEEQAEAFLDEFNILDPRKFTSEQAIL
jgi:ureidoacrylate peracid hydrolase